MKLKHLFSMTLLLLFGGTVMAKKVTADLSQGVLRGRLSENYSHVG